MADSWEDYDGEEEVIAVAQGAYDEDNDDGDVLDSWEDEADNDKKVSAPVKKKRNLDQILKERQEAEELKKKELAAKRAAIEAEENEDPTARKARLAKIVQEEDFKNAADLFGGLSVDSGAEKVKSTSAGILDSQPSTKDELEKYADALIQKVGSFKIKNAQKVAFLERLFRGVVDTVEFSDIRKLSSVLSTVSNEKQRAEKEKKTGKKTAANKKAQVKLDNSDIGGGEEFYDEGNEYDDFM